MDDEAIVDLYWARDQQAIDATDQKYGPYLHKIADNVLASDEDASECVNDTYLAAWNAIPPTRPTFLQAFLGKITRHISLDRLRKRTAQRRGGGEAELALDELAEWIPSGRDVFDDVAAKELTQTLNHFLEALPEWDRDLFMKRYWYMDSIAAIAETMGTTQAAVKSALYRTRKKLAKHLKQGGWL